MTCVDVSQAFAGAASRTCRQAASQQNTPQHPHNQLVPQARVFSSRHQYHQQPQDHHRSLDLSRHLCSPTMNSAGSSSSPSSHMISNTAPAISTSSLSLGSPALADRDDLFSAADSVTDAMSQLVRELHPGLAAFSLS